jgi:GT2 family glycosyltransferase
MEKAYSSIRFAAFIMTYERSHLIGETVQKIKEQTFPPQKILILDNSNTMQTERWFHEYTEKDGLEYYRIGRNVGPAGAAKIGLERLAQEGYDWIYWGDDDDPPFFEDTFDVLLQMAGSIQGVGCVGAVGHWFNSRKGLIDRVPDHVLHGTKPIQVHNIAGNMAKIIHADVVRVGGVLPDESLFFGLEELDFDLRLTQAGYSLFCDPSLYLRYRTESGRMGIKSKRGLKKENSRLQRDYYSIRNGLFILAKHRHYRAMVFHFLRTFYKIIQGYKFGFRYGNKQSRFLFKALSHFVWGKKGKFIFD